MNSGKDLLVYTDIGDDIDDSLALCYLIEHTAHRIRAIIVSHPDLVYSASQAKNICDLYQVGIPIIQGRSGSLDRHQFIYSNDLADQISSLTARLDTIHILAIGPCTDLAKTLLGSQRVSNIVAEIIFQGSISQKGVLDETSRNFKRDLYAAKLCTNAGLPQRFLGRDEAYLHPMREEQFMKFSRYLGVNKYLYNNAVEWQEKFKKLEYETWNKIYGTDTSILSFPYDLLAAKMI